METIKSHVRKLARKLYFKSQLIENSRVRQLGQYDPFFDKHKRQRALLADQTDNPRDVLTTEDS
jgi:hypothetical protein